MSDLLVSLCIPTNGIIEWVIPVLDSIYTQHVKHDLFEVIIADNGSNIEFESAIAKYASRKANLVYKRTSVSGFLNQTESYKIARGPFIKFINHRMKLLPGSLQSFINFAKNHMESKPIVYFSNGKIKNLGKKSIECSSFDMFVNNLSYWSSWSAGIGLWKEDLLLIDNIDFNILFPHTDILFSRRNCEKYIIDNRTLLYEIPTNWALKGNYNLFNAFAVEYISIILDLYRDGTISKKTFLKVKKDNFSYISDRYIIYVFLGKKSSFSMKGYKESINIFYNIWLIRLSIIRLPILVINTVLKKMEKLRNCKLIASGEKQNGENR